MIGTFVSIDDQCKTNLVSTSIINQIEVLFKRETDYTYIEFGETFGDAERTKALVKDAIDF